MSNTRQQDLGRCTETPEPLSDLPVQRGLLKETRTPWKKLTPGREQDKNNMSLEHLIGHKGRKCSKTDGIVKET